MSAADMAWAVCVACWCAATVLLVLFGYEMHRSECSVSARRAAQALSVSALGAAAAVTAIVLNLTT